jgi:chromosomal replication initiator protein
MTYAEQLKQAHIERKRRFFPKPEKPVAIVAPASEPTPEPIPVKEPWFVIIDETDAPLAPQPKLESIIRMTCRYFDIPRNVLISSRRTANVAYCRQVGVFIAKQMTSLSLPKIGHRFERDHTTILHACQKIHGLSLTDWRVAYDIAQIEAALRMNQ